MSITTYYYTYGAGTKPNRKIEFIRKDGGITAKIEALRLGEWKLISTLSGSEIHVEMMSTSDKVRGLIAERMGSCKLEWLNKKLSELDKSVQDNILQMLEPDGPYRIEITNGFGSDFTCEKIIHLGIFNPT